METTRKQKLIKSLKLVINNLKNNTVFYNWEKTSSCNCGLVAQSITGLDKEKLSDLSGPMFRELRKMYKDDSSVHSYTWKLAVKEYCPLTGEPLQDIFKTLFANGLTKEDIVHLEYMTNPAILKKARIRTSRFPYFGKTIGSLFPNKYYAKEKNLILYLQAWVNILEEDSSIYAMEGLSKTELEAKLLIAVADEKYEEAAAVRDLINKQ